MNQTSVVKIKMMKASQRCMALGLLGLLPFVGILFALAALDASYSARRLERQFWNPGKPQRIMGLIYASIGALIWGAVDTVIIYRMLNPY